MWGPLPREFSIVALRKSSYILHATVYFVKLVLSTISLFYENNFGIVYFLLKRELSIKMTLVVITIIS